MKTIEISKNGLYLVIGIDGKERAKLLHFSCRPADISALEKIEDCNFFNIMEMHGTGYDINDHHGSKYTNTLPGSEMKYLSHSITTNRYGDKLELSLTDERISAVIHYQFYTSLQVMRTWIEITNFSDEEFSLEYLASFTYYGLSKDGDPDWSKDSSLYIPHNTWHGELQWRKNKITELGLSSLNHFSLKRLSYEQTGTWSSSEYLPMAMYENSTAGTTMFWQIENNGSWYWECGDVRGKKLYLQIGGPNNNQNHFRKVLKKGESFTSVPVAVGIVTTGFEGSVRELTRYRRILRRDHKDYVKMKTIFNDYMNCLMADPTTEKELPLIEVAAEIGMEYYVIDAGWHADTTGGDDDWWPTVGVWEEARWRFPNGLKEVTDYIIAKGMIPGIWLEIEAMGMLYPDIGKIPKEWFFQRNGYTVMDHQRYQLDFRNPEVRDFATRTVDRLIKEYNIGYIKIDYNTNAGIGTDYQADSPGDGLLGHCRAYLKWIESILDKYPDLVLENCGSGGMRMDYAMLQYHQVQSTSDQTDYLQYCGISSMAASAVTPEQAAVWSYPRSDGTEEETIFNMVNALLGRVHQSGFLYNLSDKHLDLVKEAIACYKSYREKIPYSLPVFPLGLIMLDSPWACGGLEMDDRVLLAVWRKDAVDKTKIIPLSGLKNKDVEVRCIYPEGYPVGYSFDKYTGELSVTLEEQNTARLFEIRTC